MDKGNILKDRGKTETNKNWRTGRSLRIDCPEKGTMRRIRRRLNGKGWGFLSPASLFVFVYIFAVFITQANGKYIEF